MTKRTALVSAMLLAGLVVAVIGGTAALRFVGGGAFGPGGHPMTPADVQRSLAQQPVVQQSPAPRRSATAQATHHPGGHPARPSAPVRGSFTTSAGTVYASCLSGQVKLTSWVLAQGYLTDAYSTGPGASAWVKFQSGGTELTVSAACAGGQPRFTTATDVRGGGGEDRHGGGGGGSGSSGGGS